MGIDFLPTGFDSNGGQTMKMIAHLTRLLDSDTLSADMQPVN